MKKTKNKIYFFSDFHLGNMNLNQSHDRERKIVKWLNQIKKDAKAVYLLGDVFDFWFEYKKVVPKGFVRLLSKLSELIDDGIEIHFITGNHDMWIRDYFSNEIGIITHFENQIINIDNKKIMIGHGDGLGNGDFTYKLLKNIFTSKLCRMLFSAIHPDIGITIAQIWSKNSRKKKANSNYNKDKDILLKYCKDKCIDETIDYFIFGHNHHPLEVKINNNCTYFNLGDWITHYTYVVIENNQAFLKKF